MTHDDLLVTDRLAVQWVLSVVHRVCYNFCVFGGISARKRLAFWQDSYDHVAIALAS